MSISLRGLMMLSVCVACTLQLTGAQPQAQAGEEPLEGPNGLKVFVGKHGGRIRLLRELPHPPTKDQQNQGRNGGDKNQRGPPPKSGEISMSLGRIQEVDSSSNAISGNHGVRRPDNVDFTVRKDT